VTGRVLYLIRHGQSDLAWEGERFATARGDQWDPPLSEEGREQARLLARRLLVMDLDPFVAWSSPLRRASETAEIFSQASGTEVSIDEELVEAHIGGWEGKPFEEIIESDPEIVQHLRHQRAIWHRAPGAEGGDRFRTRVHRAVERLLRAHPDRNLLLFVHGGVINAYVGELLGLGQEMFFLPENTSLNSVDVDAERRSVRFLNDVLHLTDPGFFEEPGPILAGTRATEPSTEPRRSLTVSVKFLSDEWAEALKTELNQSEDFRRAAAGHRATIQQVITDGEGETHYWITIGDGRIDLGVGDIEGEDATITQSYDSAAALAKGELSAVTAFMTGKLKIAGNMGMILGLQGALAQLPAAMAKIDVEY
jgi:probable phosphoglycerate mutase